MIELPLILFINTFLLMLSIILGFIMMNTGVQYSLNTGNPQRQNYYKWFLLTTLLIMIMVGLIAAIFNLFFVQQ